MGGCVSSSRISLGKRTIHPPLLPRNPEQKDLRRVGFALSSEASAVTGTQQDGLAQRHGGACGWEGLQRCL